MRCSMRFSRTALSMFRLMSLALVASSFVSPAHGASFGEWLRKFVVPQAQSTGRPNDTQVDALAHQCLSCHEGPMSMNRSPGRGPGIGHAFNSHPIGSDYDQLARRKPQEYRVAALLPANIQLIEGKTSCVSCHRLKAERVAALDTGTVMLADSEQAVVCLASNELTIPQHGSKLCLSFHIK